jgi:hypothetical protein
MKRGFLDLLDPSNDPEFFWQVISGPPCIKKPASVAKLPDPILVSSTFRSRGGTPSAKLVVALVSRVQTRRFPHQERFPRFRRKGSTATLPALHEWPHSLRFCIA